MRSLGVFRLLFSSYCGLLGFGIILDVEGTVRNPFTLRVKLLILLTEPSSVTIHWKAAEQYFTLVLFVFQCYPVGNFDLNFVSSELVNTMENSCGF